MRCTLFLMLLIPSLAWAEPPVTPTAAVPQSTPPRSKGAPHICMSNYPVAAVREGRQGATELLFNITSDGTVAGVIVAASSGFLDLDVASTSCSGRWLYVPATENGTASEVSSRAHVYWTLGDGPLIERPKSSTPKVRVPATNCVRVHPEALARAEAATGNGITIVRYELQNGDVTGTVVERSSGDATLDGFATSCVQTWHFEPVKENGTPATGIHAAVIDWRQKLVLGKR